MLKNIHVPGALWTSILAAMLYAAQEQISVQLHDSIWLPLVVAAIGYVLKYLQVQSGAEPAIMPMPDEQMPLPSAAPFHQEKMSTTNKVVRFLVG